MKMYACRYIDELDLLGIIRTRVAEAGWTVDYFGRNRFGDVRLGHELHVSRGSLFYAFQSFDGFYPGRDSLTYSSSLGSGVAAHVKTGYADVKYTQQPGVYINTGAYVETGAGGGECWIFTGDGFFLISTQYAPGAFSTLFFGQMPLVVPGFGGAAVASTSSYQSPEPAELFKNDPKHFICGVSYAGESGFFTGLSSTIDRNPAGFPGFGAAGANYGEIGTVQRSKRLGVGLPGLVPVGLFLPNQQGLLSPLAVFPDLFYVSLEYLEPGKVIDMYGRRFVVIPHFDRGGWVDGGVKLVNTGLAVLLDE